MSAKEIRAGRAFVEVSIRDKLTQGLRTAWGKLKAFAGAVRAAFTAITVGVAAVGAAIGAVVAPLVIVTKRFADVGSELHDMAGRTGVAVEKLSALKYAADQSGTSLGDIERALKFMARRGIPIEKFDELAKGISAIEDPTERAAMAMAVFGRSGTDLLPMLAEWNALKKNAESLGLIVTAEEAARADELGDKIEDLKAVWSSLKFQSGEAIAGPMIVALSTMTGIVMVLRDAFAKLNIELLNTRKASLAAGGIGASVGAMLDSIGAGKLKAALGIAGGGAAAGMAAKPSSKGAASFAPQYNQLISAVRGGAFGTFSSPGSSLAGRAGQGIKRDDGMTKAIVAALEKLGVDLGKPLAEIDKGIDDLELGFE